MCPAVGGAMDLLVGAIEQGLRYDFVHASDFFHTAWKLISKHAS